MARILAIDYGTRRVGIAVTDSLQMIANPLTTVHSKDLISFLEEYLSKEEVECIVIGLPRQLNATISALEKQIEPLIKHLKRKFPAVKIDRMDERFTSKMAMQAMIAGGARKKHRQKKENIDMISATIILQSYLENKENKGDGT